MSDGISPIPSDIEVNEHVLASMRSIKGQNTEGDYLSPVVESPLKNGNTFAFNDQDDKAEIDDAVGPLDASPIVEVGIIKGTYACKPHRRSIPIVSEDTVQDDTGLMSMATLASKPVNALHKRRSFLIIQSAGTVTNYNVNDRYDVGALWTKWGLAGSDPQDNLQLVIDELALRTGLSEEEIATNLFGYIGKDAFRAVQTRVVGTIHSNAGESKLVKLESVKDYFGLAGLRVASASYNQAKRGKKTSDRTRIYSASQMSLFYKPSNPSTETPQWKATVRFMNKDRGGRPTVGGWVAPHGDPPVESIIARDWYDNATFDWRAASILHNIV